MNQYEIPQDVKDRLRKSILLDAKRISQKIEKKCCAVRAELAVIKERRKQLSSQILRRKKNVHNPIG